MVRVRLLAAAILAAGLTLAAGVPARAAVPPVPDPPQDRVATLWPAQMPAAGISGQYGPTGGGFLTLPYLGDWHIVTSIFDHCSPNYGQNGRICRFDGVVAEAGPNDPPGLYQGYPLTPGGKDDLYYEGHDGYDLSLYFEQVLAAADGQVSYADWATPGCATCGFGQGIRVDHGNGFDTLYGHLSRLLVARGQWVRRGQVIGISGKTGSVSGAHLHFGVYRHATWSPIDPFGWTGPGRDPWPEDVGNLWLSGAARTPNVAIPKVAVRAEPVTGSYEVRVSWSSPGDNVTYDLTEYADASTGISLLASSTATSAVVHGEPDHTMWFLVTAHTSLGLWDRSASPPVGFSLPARSRGPL